MARPPAIPSTMLTAPSSSVTQRPPISSRQVCARTPRLKKVSSRLMRAAAPGASGAAPPMLLRLRHVDDLHRRRGVLGLGAEPLLVQGRDRAVLLHGRELLVDLGRERRVLGEHHRILLAGRNAL